MRAIKIISMMLLAFALNVNASAEEKILAKTMEQMRHGMNTIQDGFFYNSSAKINEGLKAVKDAKTVFDKLDKIDKYLPENKANMAGMSFYISQKINSNLDNMSKAVKNNKMNAASDYYIKVIKNCSECHSVIREW